MDCGFYFGLKTETSLLKILIKPPNPMAQFRLEWAHYYTRNKNNNSEYNNNEAEENGVIVKPP